MKKANLIGQRFTKLVVIGKANNRGNRCYWLCKCDCGKEVEVTTANLRSGKTRSCGCIYFRHFQTKGGKETKIYKSWHSMKSRCYRVKDISYPRYGGRGIKVCNEWNNDFVVFQKWAYENGFREDLTLDRIDVNGDYSPENCRWVSQKEQSRNRTTNKYLTVNGVTKCYTDWSLLIGHNRSYLVGYLQRHSEEEAINKIKEICYGY